MCRWPDRIADTPCRTGAADQPRADRTGRSLVVNRYPCPCGSSVAVPRDCARGRCSRSRNSPPVWSTPGLVQVDDHLQREHEVAVEIAVQRVPVALAVAEQDGRRFALAGLVAHPQPLVQRVRPGGGAAEPRVPVPGDRQEPGVERLLEALHRLRVGGLEVAVLALAETVPAHVHRRPEQSDLVIQGAEALGLGRGEEVRQQRAAELVHLGRDRVPVAAGDALPPRVGARLVPLGARGGVHAAASRFSSVVLAAGPPTYRPGVPLTGSTRWQGSTTGSGLVAQAVPTARTAFGFPTSSATCW